MTDRERAQKLINDMFSGDRERAQLYLDDILEAFEGVRLDQSRQENSGRLRRLGGTPD